MKYTAAVIAGILAATGLLVSYVWFLSIAGVALFAYLLEKERAGGPTSLLSLGCIFGFVYSACALFWLWDVMPLSWAGLSLELGANIVLLYLLSISTVLGLFFGVFAWVYGLYQDSSVLKTLLAASLWTLTQYTQMWGFAALMLGSGALVEPHFSATMLGYSLAHFSPTLQLASLGGVYLLTFMAAGAGFSVFFLFARFADTKEKVAAFATLAVLAGACVTFLDRSFYLIPEVPIAEPTLNAGLVTTDYLPTLSVPQTFLEERRAVLHELLDKASSTVAVLGVIVFPETVNAVRGPEEVSTEAFRRILGDRQVSVVDTAEVVTRNGTVKRAYVYAPGGAIIGSYDKFFLLPQAEYEARLFSPADALVSGEIRYVSGSAPGEKPIPVEVPGARLGVLIGSDALSPSLYGGLTRDGANVLVHVGDYRWLHHKYLGNTLALTLLKVRAVENNRYLLAALNGAPSVVVASNGEVYGQRPNAELALVNADVPLVDSPSIYARIHQWLLIFPLLIVLTLFGLQLYQNRSTTNRTTA